MQKLDILFEDDDLLVVNKPPGLRVIPDGYDANLPSVRAILENEYGRLFIVHRLDKDTSGVLLIARNPSCHRNLNTQFQEHRVTKEYHALVFCPTPFPSELTIEAPLLVNGDRRHRTVVDKQHGKSASTEFHLLRQFDHIALVKALPKSGYTHQIRSHALYASFPLLGDPLYRFGSRQMQLYPAFPDFPRTALHAINIAFFHPVSGEKIEFSSPIPADIAEFIAEISKTAEE